MHAMGCDCGGRWGAKAKGRLTFAVFGTAACTTKFDIELQRCERGCIVTQGAHDDVPAADIGVGCGNSGTAIQS